jgi:hypothetical protein
VIDWPDKLIHDIARRRCIAFLGAGVSRRSINTEGKRPPLWKEFLEAAIGKCEGSKSEVNKLIKAGDYLSACQLIKSRLGAINWHDLLEEMFLHPNYAPADIHQTIFDLDLPIVATTNIDTIYDRFLGAKYNAAVVIKPYHDDSIGRYVKSDASTRVVIKIHGSVDHLDHTVFTREEYASSRYRYVHFYDLLSSLISTQTFLFIGYSLSDPDINLILEDNARRFKSQRPHYLVTADKVSNDMIRLYEDNYSIKIIKYNPASDHLDLVDSLRKLASQASDQRASMASSQIW